MALFFPGKTACVLCDAIIESGEEIVSFPAFLPAAHRLDRYSDAVLHAACFQSWPEREEFQRLYSKFRDAWDKRPAIPAGMSFQEFEQSQPCLDFNQTLRTLFDDDGK